MKMVKITLFMMTLIIFVLFMVAYSMTPAPWASSGNGNPAILLLFALVPLFIVMSVLWWTLLRFYPIRASWYLIGASASLLHLTVAFFYQQYRLEEYRDVIRQAIINRNGVADEQYVQNITTGLSFHTNNQIFNINTFFMFLTASILMAMIFRFWDQWDERKKPLPVQKER